MEPDPIAAVQERYRRFARDEAPGRSALYGVWAEAVAASDGLAGILARIPAERRQPPLVFAVTRLLGASTTDAAAWPGWLVDNADLVVAEASRRRLQTNEPLRCAALLPALALVPGPIALLELGASAGLCLYPDRYSYRYTRPDGAVLEVDPVAAPSRVVLHSTLDGDPRLRLPDVVWRAGIDLAPLDAADPADRAFLRALVWPGESGRTERIRAALDMVAADPPRLIAGDASDPAVLEASAALAPRDATLVVTTPGLLPHVPRADRERLIAAVRELDAVWISIDPPGLRAVGDPPVDTASWGGFVLTIDDHPVAAVDPLGASVEWRAGGRRRRG